MMQRCSSSGVAGGPCSCGSYHCPQNSSGGGSSFSMLFSPLDHYKSYDHHDPSQAADVPYYSNSYNNNNNNNSNNNYYNSSSSSSSVDCTLSLGTPSTRADHDHPRRSSTSHHHHQQDRRSFCWDILQGTKAAAKSSPRPPGNNNNNADPLLARRCANCDTTSTPLWRNGPRGPKSLCNACGIRFKKEERRATAASAVNAGQTGVDHYGNQQNYYGYGSNTTSSSSSSTTSWVHPSSQKMGCYSPAGEFRFMDQDSNDRDNYQYQSSDAGGGIPNFLSWRLNVTDRPGLVHDFTR